MVSTKRKRSSFWVFAVLTVVLTGVAAGGLHRLNQSGRDGAADETQRAEPAVADAGRAPERVLALEGERITVREVQRSVGAVGSFSGYDEVTVPAEVSGRVAEVYHDIGDIVRPGEELMKLDTTEFELELEQTRRALELELVRLGVQVPPELRALDEISGLVRTFDVKHLPAVAHVQQLAEIAHLPLQRMEELLQGKAINEEDIQQLKKEYSEYAVAKAALAMVGEALRTFEINALPSVIRAQKLEEIAQTRLERAEELQGTAMSEEDVQQRKTERDVAKAALDQAYYDAQGALAAIRHRSVLLRIAMRKLELATVVVPTPKRREFMPEQVQYAVMDRKVTEGEMLKDAPGTSTATFELVMDGVLKLEVQVPERYADEVGKEQDVQIHVDAHPDQVFSGKVLRINPSVDRTSRTFGVQVYVPNPERKLKAGGFAEVEILTRVDPQAWTVSPESIVTYAGSTRVFVVRDGKAHAMSAEKGIEGTGWVELIHAANADLRVDDIVIRGGQDKLAEGVPVQIRNAAGLGQTAGPPSATR